MNGARLEKSAKAEMVPGKSVITIGRCTTEYTLQSPTADTEGTYCIGRTPCQANSLHMIMEYTR